MLASAIGVFTLLFAASSLVVELGDALNTIWHVAPAATSSGWGDVRDFLKQRMFSFGIILGTGFLLLISLMVSAAISAVAAIVHGRMSIPPAVLRTAEFLLAFSVTTLLFAAIYKVMPAVRLRWSDVFIGACATSLFFNAGKQVVGLYLGRESFASTYGAAGSLVAVLVWVYYSAQLFFFGAEFTKVYARRFGSFRNVSTEILPGR
jgi:membrane protein